MLGSAAWLVRLGWLHAPYWVLVAWGLALCALIAIGILAWIGRSALSVGRMARRLEEMGAWRRGALTALLDAAAPGTSGSLLELADQVQAEDLGRRGPGAVQPIARPVRALTLAGGGVLLLGLAAFGSAGPGRLPLRRCGFGRLAMWSIEATRSSCLSRPWDGAAPRCG